MSAELLAGSERFGFLVFTQLSALKARDRLARPVKEFDRLRVWMTRHGS